MDLQELRDKIDKTDKQILKLFEHRMELCREVAVYKQSHGIPVFQRDREDEVIQKIRSSTSDENLKNGTAALFTSIMDISKHLQQQEMLKKMPLPERETVDIANAAKIGCQGTFGSYSALAASFVFGDLQPVFFKTFEDVFIAVENGGVDYGVIPIHNSTAGSVTQTYDLLTKYNVYIIKSVCLAINHCLAVKHDCGFEQITSILSHPQALAQCSDFIAKTGIPPVNCDNTATAARTVFQSEEMYAAICSEECANRFDLKIIERNIANASHNFTKFICISKKFAVLPDADIISVVLKLPNSPGSLYRIMAKFFAGGMNLDKLESRPIANGSFDVMFYLDFKGNINDKNVLALLADMEQNLEFFRFLGTHSESMVEDK